MNSSVLLLSTSFQLGARLPLPANTNRQFAIAPDIQTQRIISVRPIMTVRFIHRFESFTSQKIEYHNPNSISNNFVEKRPCTYSTYRAVWRLLCALSNDPISVLPVVSDHDCIVRGWCRNLDHPRNSFRLSSNTPSNNLVFHSIKEPYCQIVSRYKTMSTIAISRGKVSI